MNAFVEKFYHVEEINRKRAVENSANKSRSQRGCSLLGMLFGRSPVFNDIPMLECKVNAVIDITEEDVEKYFLQLNPTGMRSSREEYPYFSFVADNAENELQVYLHSSHGDDSPITGEDFSVRTPYYVSDESKYRFYNP